MADDSSFNESAAESEMTGAFIDKAREEIAEFSKAERVRQYWEEQAKKYGPSLSAVNADPHMEVMSTEAILREIEHYQERIKTIADIGCGNGILTGRIAAEFPSMTVRGFDYSEEFIKIAESKRPCSNIHYAVGDITGNAIDGGPYDCILGRRVLVNVGGKIMRQRALANIANGLRRGGIYLMAECFQEPLERTNIARKSIGLATVKVREQNEYLNLSEIADLADRSGLSIFHHVHYGDLYYFVSRVLNAGMGFPDYKSGMIDLALQISKEIEIAPSFAPESLVLMRKVK